MADVAKPTSGGGGEGEAPQRQRWSSRLAFIFATIGAAVGFGNVWRFPALCYEYGGGAFFIPYLIALFVIGIPITILELSLGQYYQSGDCAAFGSIHARLRGIGLSSVMNSFFICGYYSTLIGWVVKCFFESFRKDVDWTAMTGDEAFDYFVTSILGMSTTDTSQWANLTPTTVVGANVGYNALVWFIIFGCLAFGLKWTGRITYFTMGLPIVLLFVFLIRAVTLPGAEIGIKAYIGEWDMQVLSDRPDVWSTAVTQIFFSIGVTFGVITAFGSYNERDAPVTSNSFIIALGNSCFSFIAGFAVFASIGFLANEKGIPVSEAVSSGPSLVFSVWPVILASLPGGENWVRLHFFNLFLLGLDSGFALIEAVITVVKDTELLTNVKHFKVAGGTILVGFICSILYCTDTGFLFLDAVDFYINFIMLLVGGFECFAVGWVTHVERQVADVGKAAVFSYWSTTFGSVIVASGLWFGLEKNALWAGFVGGILCYLAGMALTIFLAKKAYAGEGGMKGMMYDLTMRNIVDFQAELESKVGFLPRIWGVLIKHLLPQILLILFINLASATSSSGKPTFGNYSGYVSWPYQVLGILVVVLTIFVILIGFAIPQAYQCFHVAMVPSTEEPTKDVKVVDALDLEAEGMSPPQEPAIESA